MKSLLKQQVSTGHEVLPPSTFTNSIHKPDSIDTPITNSSHYSSAIIKEDLDGNGDISILEAPVAMNPGETLKKKGGVIMRGSRTELLG